MLGLDDVAAYDELLLAQLTDVPDGRRAAHFTCAASRRTTRPPSEAGWRAGSSATRETRGTGGFGYDVLFVADEHPGATTAELSIDDKDAISHRGKALRELAPLVARRLGASG